MKTIGTILVLVVLGYIIYRIIKKNGTTISLNSNSSSVPTKAIGGIVKDNSGRYSCTLVNDIGESVTLYSDTDNALFEKVCNSQTTYPQLYYYPTWGTSPYWWIGNWGGHGGHGGGHGGGGHH